MIDEALMQTVTDAAAPSQSIGIGLSGQRRFLATSQAKRARRAMKEFRSFGDWKERRTQIAALAKKVWHGRLVFKLVCSECEKERWEGEFVCWYLVSLKRHICPWCLVRG